MRNDTEDHLLFDTVIFGFLTIFKNFQVSSTFEAVNSNIALEMSKVRDAPFRVEVEI